MMEDDMATNQAELIQQTYDENIKKLDRGIYELQEALKACEDVEQMRARITIPVIPKVQFLIE